MSSGAWRLVQSWPQEDVHSEFLFIHLFLFFLNWIIEVTTQRGYCGYSPALIFGVIVRYGVPSLFFSDMLTVGISIATPIPHPPLIEKCPL